jgi:hypothetical protein
MRLSNSTRTGRPQATRRAERQPEETKMNTLSITSTRTMTYDAAAAVQGFAIAERLVNFTGALLQAARKIGSVSTVPALRAAQA